MEDDHQELECAICSHPYGDQDRNFPKTLPCGHSYCATCVGQLVQDAASKQRVWFQCPECRRELPSYCEFPRNYSLMSVVERKKTKTDEAGSCSNGGGITTISGCAVPDPVVVPSSTMVSSSSNRSFLAAPVLRRFALKKHHWPMILAAFISLLLLTVVLVVLLCLRPFDTPTSSTTSCFNVRFHNRGAFQMWGGYSDCFGGGSSSPNFTTWTGAMFAGQSDEHWVRENRVIWVQVAAGMPGKRSYTLYENSDIFCYGILFDWWCVVTPQPPVNAMRII